MRWELPLVAVAASLLVVGAAAGQEAEVAPDSEADASPTPTPTPETTRPITASIEPVVERWWQRERAEPCPPGRDDEMPCFPTRIDVPDSDRAKTPLAALGADDFVARPDFTRNANGSVVGGVGFDPVCAVKSIAKGLSGRNDRYYLYRVWSARGEEVILRETKLEPGARLGDPDYRFELIDEIRGECAAVAAWRKANGESR